MWKFWKLDLGCRKYGVVNRVQEVGVQYRTQRLGSGNRNRKKGIGFGEQGIGRRECGENLKC